MNPAPLPAHYCCILIDMIYALLIGMVAVTIALALMRDLAAVAAGLGFLSLLAAGFFLAAAAPDVAITEAAVGAAAGTAFFVLAVGKTGRRVKKKSFKPLVAVVTSSAIFACLAFVSVELPEFGSASSPAASNVAAHYVAKAEEETGVPNVVTAVLASYRGFDTLGELVVILTAFVVVALMARKEEA